MNRAMIETRALGKQFGGQWAVADLNLALPRGTLYGLIGPNGAGKTTTLRLLAGLLPPSQGEVVLDGQGLAAGHQPGRVYRLVGYMPDFFGVYEDMRCWEYLDFFGRCYAIPPDRRRQLVTELLELVGLSAKRDVDVNSLSRGMKQRLCLAHALVHDPAVLLLDEPASGLDPRARLEMRELLRELRAMGRTIVISSHILPELAEICDSLGIMERGRLVAEGSLADLAQTAQAGHTVRLELLSPLPSALSVLAGLGATVTRTSLETEDEARGEDGGWIELHLAGDARARADMVAQLAAAGVLLSAVRPQGGDLEDLFIRLTKGELA